MKLLYIYLFRHGQTFFNRDEKFTGWLNPGLTSTGFKQAKTVAKKLKNKKFQIAFQTKLKRSKQTLQIVLKYHPECKKILTDNRMIERNYGNLNGKTHESFMEKIGKKLLKLDVEGDAIENFSPKKRKELEKFLGREEYKLIHRGYNVPPQNGESFAMVENRVSKFINDLIKLMKKQKVNVAISAHGNSIRLFRKILERADKKQVVKWFIPYDKVFVYKIKA